jgi:hypothetical protein
VAVNSHGLGFSKVYVPLDQIDRLATVAAITEIFVENVDRALNPDVIDFRVPKFLLVTADFTEIVQERHDSRALRRHSNLWVGFQKPHEFFPYIHAMLAQTTFIVAVEARGSWRRKEVCSF